jgi:hypothetical protein
MDIDSFYKLLEGTYWNKGHHVPNNILQHSCTSPQHRRLFIAYKKYVAGETTKPILDNYK